MTETAQLSEVLCARDAEMQISYKMAARKVLNTGMTFLCNLRTDKHHGFKVTCCRCDGRRFVGAWSTTYATRKTGTKWCT